MQLNLNSSVEKLIDDWVRSGLFATPEDVIAAAISALERQEQFGDFEAGELDALLEEGERSIEEHGTMDGDEAHKILKERRAQRNKR